MYRDTSRGSFVRRTRASRGLVDRGERATLGSAAQAGEGRARSQLDDVPDVFGSGGYSHAKSASGLNSRRPFLMLTGGSSVGCVRVVETCDGDPRRWRVSSLRLSIQFGIARTSLGRPLMHLGKQRAGGSVLVVVDVGTPPTRRHGHRAASRSVSVAGLG